MERPAATGTAFIHIVIFCWPGQEANTRHIASSVADHADRLTVIYKSDCTIEKKHPAEWEEVPPDWYFGRQFRQSLKLHQGGIMLQIQADARYPDWPGLVNRCRNAFASMPDVGIWTPNVYHSWYTPQRTKICRLRDDELCAVTVTDGVVWALAPEVAKAMKALNYGANNLGWGITETGAAIAASLHRLVVMDLTLHVDHPQGSGYDRARALQESHLLISSLPPALQVHIFASRLLCKLRDEPRLLRFLRRSYWRRKLRALRRSPSGHEVGPRLTVSQPEQ